MSYQKCLDAIRESAGELTDNELEQLAEELQRRQKLNEASGKFVDSEAAALAAAEQMSKDMKLAAAIAKREAADNEVKFLKAVSYLNSQWDGRPGRSAGEGIASLIYSSNKVADSGRRSVMGYQNGTRAKLQGAFFSDLLAVDKAAPEMLASGHFDEALMRAMYDIRQGKTPTGPEFVPEIAQVLVKHQEYWRNLKNENGAWIGKLDDYIVSRSHNPTLIKNAGYDQWKADIEQHIDWERTLAEMPDKDPDEFLRNVYKGLAYGHHLKSGPEPSGFKGPANLAKKLSQERVLHFKGPEAEYAYAQKYASGGLGFQLMMSLEHTSQSVGLMKVLGANPGAMIEKLIKHANDTTPTGVTPMERHQIEVALKSVDGTMKSPVSDVMARVTTYTLAAQSMSKLGGALLSQFGDIAPRMMEFKRQGMGPLDAIATQVKGFVEGLGGKEKQEALLDIVGLTDALTAEMTRAAAVDPIGGTTAKAMDMFFRITGQHRWQQGAEGAAAVMMAQNLARRTADDFGNLPADLQVLLRQHGIGEAEWGAIRQGSQKAMDGVAYLSPQSPKDLPDSAIDGLLEKQGVLPPKKDVKTIELFHGTKAQIGVKDLSVTADIGPHFTTARETAELFANDGGKAGYVLRARAAFEKPLELPDLGTWFPTNVARAIDESRGLKAGEMDQTPFQKKVWDVMEAARIDSLESKPGDVKAALAAADKAGFDLVRAELKSMGHDSIKYVNTHEGAPVDTFIALDMGKVWGDGDTPPKLGPDEAKLNRLRNKMREELSDRLYNFFSDRVGFAAIKPDAKTRAMLLQGTQPGTWLGTGMRLVTQFKSFPIAFLQKAMGSSLYGSGANTMGEAVRSSKAMGSVAQLVLASTALGYMSMTAKDLVKGREPRDPTDPRTMMAALQQGGGLGIYGDFLFGEAKSRTGGTLVSNLAGPTLGTLDDMTDIWRRIRNGDDAAAKTFSTALSNTPFMNVFYLRPVLDYMILHSLTEAMNPGALRRREALVTRENEQGWLLRPSQNYADPLGIAR